MKRQFVTIYKYPTDCTNHGVSSRYDYMEAFDGDLNEVWDYVHEKGIDIDRCLYLVRRELFGRDAHYFTPLKYAVKQPDGVLMMGGNYCCTSDSRWREEWFEHSLPIPIHDRLETYEQYEIMSR